MKVLSIFDYRETKIPLVLELYKKTDICTVGSYYFDADWEQGPNILLVSKQEISNEIFQQIKKITKKYIEINMLDDALFLERQTKYKRNQRVLQQTEMRKIKKNYMCNDGDVVWRALKSHVFNSSIHEQRTFQYRCELNAIYMKILKKFNQLSDREIANLFVYQYRYIAGLSREGVAFGYISFLSHVQGFFSRLENKDQRKKIKANFSALYKQFFSTGISCPVILEEEITMWEKKWLQIAEGIYANFNIKDYEEAGYVNIDEQITNLLEGLLSLDNRFHRTLADLEDAKDYMMSEIMLTSRDIVNLFFLSLPLFEQSMLRKQFYAYATVISFENELTPEQLTHKFEG